MKNHNFKLVSVFFFLNKRNTYNVHDAKSSSQGNWSWLGIKLLNYIIFKPPGTYTAVGVAHHPTKTNKGEIGVKMTGLLSAYKKGKTFNVLHLLTKNCCGSIDSTGQRRRVGNWWFQTDKNPSGFKRSACVTKWVYSLLNLFNVFFFTEFN